MNWDKQQELIQLRNLRHQDGKLVPVGKAALITDKGGKPLAVASHDNEKWLIHAQGLIVKATTLAGDQTIEMGQLAAEPLCAVPTNDGELTVMTADGAEFIEWSDNGWTLIGATPEFPPISFTATEGAAISTTIKGGTLSGNYPHGDGTLNSDDVETLTADCLEAYRSIHAIAEKAGMELQPVLAKYRVLDKDGGELFSSAPVLIGEGFQCVGDLTAKVSGTDRQGARLEAQGWRLGVVAPARLTSRWGKRAASVEILASRGLHPVRINGRVEGSLSESATNESTLTFSMPGVATGQAGEAQRNALAVAALDRREPLMEVVARFPAPFDGGIGTPGSVIALPQRESANLDSIMSEQTKIMAKAVEREVGNPAATMARCAMPHRFSADCVAANGGTLLWGNPVAHKFKGYPLGIFATKTGNNHWRANIAVEMADRAESLVWSGEGTEMEPTMLNPLLTYPSPEAKTMTITIASSSGKIYRERLPLTPTPRGDAAYYLRDSLKSWMLATETPSYAIPAENPLPYRMSGRVLSAAASLPTTPLGALWLSPTPLVKLTKAVRSGSTWDFGKAHFYGFSEAGIWGIGVNSSQVTTGANLISCIGVDHAMKVAEGDDAVWALTRHGTMKVSGNRGKIVNQLSEAQAIGWNPANGGEIWLLMDGEWRVIDPDSGQWASRDPDEATGLFCDGGEMIILSRAGFLDATREISGNMDVGWKVRTAAGKASVLTLHAAAAEIDGKIQLRCDGGAGAAGSLPILSAKIRGMLNAPIRFRFLAPRRAYTDIGFDGTVSPDAHFESVKLE